MKTLIELAKYPHLKSLKEITGEGDLIYSYGVGAKRCESDGVTTLIVENENFSFGILLNNFKVNGGSFGKENSLRIANFIKYLTAKNMPLVGIYKCIGVRIMEGRTVFNNAFSLIPEFSKFKEKNLLISIANGKCLGLGGILFGLGHLKIGIKDVSKVNLTGPEVMNKFFGHKVDFDKIADNEKHLVQTHLIDEISPSFKCALRKSRVLISGQYNVSEKLERSSVEDKFEGEYFDPNFLSSSNIEITTILKSISTSYHEIFSQLSLKVKSFVIERNGVKFGLLMNPPKHAYNMIDSSAIRKYSLSLDLFKALRLPIISFVDTPGVDPRESENGRDIISSVIDISTKIINYPYPKMGVIYGRSYGGASILNMPKIFGGQKVVALEGSRVGIMGEDIVTSLFESSARLSEQWEEVLIGQRADLCDLIENDTIDKVVNEEGLYQEIKLFLNQDKSERELLKMTELLSEQASHYRVNGFLDDDASEIEKYLEG